MDIDIKKFVSEEEMEGVVKCATGHSDVGSRELLAEGWVTLPVILWPELSERLRYRFVRIWASRSRRTIHIQPYQDGYGFQGAIPPPVSAYLKAMLITDPFEQVKVMEGWRRYVR